MNKKTFAERLRRDWPLCLMVIPGIVLIFIFHYIPIYGVLMAFQNYNPGKGILGSQWVGLRHFASFFRDPFCWRIIRNTLWLGALSLVFGFPAPIIFALLINELNDGVFKRVTQTISYMPTFISIVIVVGLMMELFGLRSGIVNDLIELLGGQRINFFDRREWFRTLYTFSGIWQGIGYGSILYLAAISGVDQEMYESAVLDGAGRFRQMLHITLPAIAPTIQIQLIFAVGGLLSASTEKVLLMYRPTTYETADIIGTYIYRYGLEGGKFSYSAAVGIFLSVIALILTFSTNWLNRKVGAASFF